MYKILLATDREDILHTFDQIAWEDMDIRPPYVAKTAQLAIDLLNSKAIDAVGVCFENDEEGKLNSFLHYERPSMSIYRVTSDEALQKQYISELKDMLNEMRKEYVNAELDNESIRILLRDELTHRMLCKQYTDPDIVERKFKLIRAHISFTRPCVVYELDMPQGEIYVSQHTNAMERLERAMRNNFFGRETENDNTYYGVAVIAPRHIRVVAIPRAGEEQKIDEFTARADRHINDTITQIINYLDLDLSVRERTIIPNLKSFFEQNNK